MTCAGASCWMLWPAPGTMVNWAPGLHGGQRAAVFHGGDAIQFAPHHVCRRGDRSQPGGQFLRWPGSQRTRPRKVRKKARRWSSFQTR